MMKTFLCFLLFFMIFFSCAMPGDDSFRFDNPKFKNMEEACEWVNNNIKYEKDSYDDWKLPQETLDDRTGDCEDMALLLMGIANYQFDYKPQLLVIEFSSNSYHAIVNKGNDYYDPTSGKIKRNVNYRVTNKYDYDTAMYIAKYVKNY